MKMPTPAGGSLSPAHRDRLEQHRSRKSSGRSPARRSPRNSPCPSPTFRDMTPTISSRGVLSDRSHIPNLDSERSDSDSTSCNGSIKIATSCAAANSPRPAPLRPSPKRTSLLRPPDDRSPKSRRRKRSTSPASRPSYQCPHSRCSFIARTPNALLVHRGSLHLESVFLCPNCTFRARRKQQVKEHFANAHASITEGGGESHWIFCEVEGCGHGARTKNAAAVHRRRVHGEDFLVCGYSSLNYAGNGCNYRCRTEGGMERHRESHKSAEREAKREQDELFEQARERVRKKKQEEQRKREKTEEGGIGGEEGSEEESEKECFQRPAFVGIPNTAGLPLPPNHWLFSSPWARLGLPENASLDLVKAHYRRLALRYHPDKCSKGEGEAEKRFRAVREAYDTLSK